MNFEEYKIKFSEKAKEKNKDDNYIQICLNYANQLINKNLPVIYDLKHFSLLVGVDDGYIKRAVTYTNKYYWYFTIPKHDGGKRQISEPLPTLKNIQLWILHNILEKRDVHPFAKAYVPGKKLKENAKYHTKQKVVIGLDICNFFLSIRTDSIANIYLNLGYSKKVSYMLANLCCLGSRLPQGAPTSPYLSNLFMYEFDSKIVAFCKEHEYIYTRYADDLTFSSKSDISLQELKDFVIKELKAINLELNEKKTKIMHSYNAQIVTGIEVNNRMRLPKKARKDLRQEMYYVITRGIDDHLKHIGCNKNNYLKHLIGKIIFALSLEPSNSEFVDYNLYLQKLINPKFIQRKKKLILSNEITLQEQIIKNLPSNYVQYIKSDKKLHNICDNQIAYSPNNCHFNSLIFAQMINSMYTDYEVQIIEGIVVMTDGFAYEHFWNEIYFKGEHSYYDITADVFYKEIKKAKNRRYYKIKEYSINELANRLNDNKIFTQTTIDYINKYYTKYPQKANMYFQ